MRLTSWNSGGATPNSNISRSSGCVLQPFSNFARNVGPAMTMPRIGEAARLPAMPATLRLKFVNNRFGIIDPLHGASASRLNSSSADTVAPNVCCGKVDGLK
jgi:hypothetical protein